MDNLQCYIFIKNPSSSIFSIIFLKSQQIQINKNENVEYKTLYFLLQTIVLVTYCAANITNMTNMHNIIIFCILFDRIDH